MGGFGPVNCFNHSTLVSIGTLTDRPKSISNRCVIEVSLALLCCHVSFLDLFVDLVAIAFGLSHISSFFSLY